MSGRKGKAVAAAEEEQDDGLGQRPELKWVKLSQLFIPTDYQRSVKSDASAKNINHIRGHFSWAKFGSLIVCPIPGSNPPQFAVIDGQHRFRAAEARGDIAELPCVVISEREAREQAESFVAINSRRVRSTRCTRTTPRWSPATRTRWLWPTC